MDLRRLHGTGILSMLFGSFCSSASIGGVAGNAAIFSPGCTLIEWHKLPDTAVVNKPHWLANLAIKKLKFNCKFKSFNSACLLEII